MSDIDSIFVLLYSGISFPQSGHLKICFYYMNSAKQIINKWFVDMQCCLYSNNTSKAKS